MPHSSLNINGDEDQEEQDKGKCFSFPDRTAASAAQPIERNEVRE